MRILVLGAGFGGLELCSTLSEALGEAANVTLIDKADAFVFGYSKLDVMFGKAALPTVRLPYRNFVKPGVSLKQETVVSIDPSARKVITNVATYEADILIIALGADYDVSSTPGIVLGQNEFYSVRGAEHLRDVLPSFKRGHAVIGVCGAPYKCPPAPSECALMLHDYLVSQGVRGDCHITLVNPLPSPVPPSPDTSKALIAAFAERNINYLPNRKVISVDGSTVTLDDHSTLPADLFLGIPKNRAPDVVVAAGMCENGWVPVDPHTLQTKYDNVFAVGDLANTGVPKAGLFAETAARAVAQNILSMLQNQPQVAKNPGAGTCYIEFGDDRVARVDVDFLSGPKATGTYHPPSEALIKDKKEFGSIRRARWFGIVDA